MMGSKGKARDHARIHTMNSNILTVTVSDLNP